MSIAWIISASSNHGVRMSSPDQQPQARSAIPAIEKFERGAFYGYNYYLDGDGRFLGEEKAGSNSFHVFASKMIFEQAVSAYNILGRVEVKSAAIGRA